MLAHDNMLVAESASMPHSCVRLVFKGEALRVTGWPELTLARVLDPWGPCDVTCVELQLL